MKRKLPSVPVKPARAGRSASRLQSLNLCIPSPWPSGEDTKVKFRHENPRHPDSECYNRYERYKAATLIADARRLGAKYEDLFSDRTHGYLIILPGQDQIDSEMPPTRPPPNSSSSTSASSSSQATHKEACQCMANCDCVLDAVGGEATPEETAGMSAAGKIASVPKASVSASCASAEVDADPFTATLAQELQALPTQEEWRALLLSLPEDVRTLLAAHLRAVKTPPQESLPNGSATERLGSLWQHRAPSAVSASGTSRPVASVASGVSERCVDVIALAEHLRGLVTPAERQTMMATLPAKVQRALKEHLLAQKAAQAAEEAAQAAAEAAQPLAAEEAAQALAPSVHEEGLLRGAERPKAAAKRRAAAPM
ncbi:unnamed protein product [Polarella glacialis]|uniref:Uncharacterized protein n=1 Tax=Polarella glacialis TaxID=89957 RepID=A0A813DML3_POLGL|nr:unnamed protein product [Polarella glacialis]